MRKKDRARQRERERQEEEGNEREANLLSKINWLKLQLEKSVKVVWIIVVNN